MAIKYDFNENNKKITERRETTPAKNPVDNSSSIMYNGNKGINT